MRSLSVRKDICDIELAKLVPRSSDLLTSPHFSARAQQFCFHFFVLFFFLFYCFYLCFHILSFFAFNILLPKSSDHVTTSIFQHVHILSLSQHDILGLSIFQDLWTLSLSQLFIRGNLTFQELCSPSLSLVIPNI